ncbi:AimR family lysis-lysogeny pheromone receptor [Bacillus halotolerans]|uniref:AimR family lysis-lysogeny pheromone receptor n=1 Tax=Bacillus halotolerans TaxID=260554 RepID=UPI001D0ED194|nr:AimR family lysis-lysogeny pheromone receptor [Bacillus halotolerans]MCC2526783.1 AimR family lysis-lysogeny pheromone receptor [Bacillus halotolerans]
MTVKEREVEKTNVDVKVQLEMSDINEQYETTEKLIRKLINSNCSIEREWAEMYKIKRNLDTGEINAHQALKKIGKLDPKTQEMRVFTYIIPLYHYLRYAEYTNLVEMYNLADVDLIKDNEVIKKSYYNRLVALLASANLSQNNLVGARYLCSYGIHNTHTDRFIAYSYLNMGNSYIFENYDKAKENFLEGLKHSMDNPDRKLQITRSLAFLENLWGKENKWINRHSTKQDDLYGQAFELIVKKEHDQAIIILDQLFNTGLCDNQLGFHYYYLGLIYDHQDFFLKSVEHFKKSGEKFYLECPLSELRRLGADNKFLELLAI